MSIQNLRSQSQETKHIEINLNNNNIDTELQDSFLDQGHDDKDDDDDDDDIDDGEIFGMILCRSQSTLSSYFHRLRTKKQNSSSGFESAAAMKTYSMRIEKPNSFLDSAIRRAFSMKASPSVSEDYCRIDHQYESNDADEENLLKPRLAGTYKKRGNIFEACRRFFGL